jgi:hypothetical protein
VSGQPRTGQHDRRPPTEAGQHDRRGEAGDDVDQPDRDEIHGDEQRRTLDAHVEVARHGQVGGELLVFEVTDAGRIDAGGREPVVQPGRGAVAEIGADRRVYRAEHLQREEHHAGEDERTGQPATRLHGADQHTDGDGQHRRQQATGKHGGPPRDRQAPVGAWQGGEEVPLRPCSQTSHSRDDTTRYRQKPDRRPTV